MQLFVQRLFDGLQSGAIYAILALAIVIIFRASGMLNFAQGEIAMFTTFVAWNLFDTGLPWWVASIASLVIGFVVGAVLYRILIVRLGGTHANPLAVVMVTIGLFLMLNDGAGVVWGTNAKPVPRVFGDGRVELLGAGIAVQVLGILVVLGVLVVGFGVLFQRTKLGLALRAVTSNQESAALAGIKVTTTLMVGWGLASAIGSLAGTFTASANLGVDKNMMQIVLIYAFAAATLGGFDSPLGAVVGGLIIGVVSELVVGYVAIIGPDMKLLPGFLLVLIVLMVRPQGLFGTAKVGRA
ncbi:MAG: branched-chain amino acid ABC transporter permease [Microthrixaceae bacterium]